MLRSLVQSEPLKMAQTVAVIGAGKSKDPNQLVSSVIILMILSGACGLSMLKTLREDGFKVTCYERRKQVGGLWAYTDDPSMTTALPSTSSSLSNNLNLLNP